MSDRPFAINGGKFGELSRKFADYILSLEKMPPDPPYQDFLLEEQRKAAAIPRSNDHPYGISGGGFGKAARAGADRFGEVAREIPPAFANYGENRDRGMEILIEFLRRKFGQ